MAKTLQTALEVWSDGMSLRHMDSRQHLWISQVVVLGLTLLEDQETYEKVKQSKSFCKLATWLCPKGDHYIQVSLYKQTTSV